MTLLTAASNFAVARGSERGMRRFELSELSLSDVHWFNSFLRMTFESYCVHIGLGDATLR
jgi:hypothetical protein